MIQLGTLVAANLGDVGGRRHDERQNGDPHLPRAGGR